MIHTAAHDYYYGSRFGLTSPPTLTGYFGIGQLKIAAREKSGKSSHSHIRSELSFGISANVHIKAWGSPPQGVYGTTIHELAHAAHWVLDGSSYDNLVRDAWTFPIQGDAVDNNRRLLETWASTVEILFAVERYKNKFSLPNYEYFYNNYQNQKILDDIHYTSGGWDMMDNINQRTDPRFGNGDTRFPIDRVSGYTINQLEQALRGAKTWWQWRDNIKSKYPDNPTKEFLDELFNNWGN